MLVGTEYTTACQVILLFEITLITLIWYLKLALYNADSIYYASVLGSTFKVPLITVEKLLNLTELVFIDLSKVHFVSIYYVYEPWLHHLESEMITGYNNLISLDLSLCFAAFSYSYSSILFSILFPLHLRGLLAFRCIVQGPLSFSLHYLSHPCLR